MEIGNDDLDFMDDVYASDNASSTTTQDIIESDSEISVSIDETEADSILNDDSKDYSEEKDLILSLLESRGIEDKSKIKFENDQGEVEEVDWDSLSNEDRLNILDSSIIDPETYLDDSEIELINAIRQSLLSPSEYLQAIQQFGIDNVYNTLQNTDHIYKVDDISNEELYVIDLISRSLDITEEEAFEALDKAKLNEALFLKLIEAIRNEYKIKEDESFQYELLRMQQEAQEKFERFANNVEISISNFTELAGGKLDMDQDDMQELYDFITGFDAAGNSYFGKALNDYDTLVKMAWFVLNGEETIKEIEDYYNKEITKAREEGYKKGLLKSKDVPKVVHKNIQKTKPKTDIYYDLDDI